MDDRLYSSLKTIARVENRSVSQEVISILEKYLSNPAMYTHNPTKEFLSLSGSWSDDQTAEEMISDVKKNRNNSRRFKTENVIFD